jgi:hypothetical protein
MYITESEMNVQKPSSNHSHKMPKKQMRILTTGQVDVDKQLYSADDYRKIMSSLSPTSKVTFDFYAGLTKVTKFVQQNAGEKLWEGY